MRYIVNKKEKFYQWWSFHQLSNDDIIEEIMNYIYLYSTCIRHIYINGNVLYHFLSFDTHYMRRNKIESIIRQYIYDNSFKECILTFDTFKVKLFKTDSNK